MPLPHPSPATAGDIQQPQQAQANAAVTADAAQTPPAQPADHASARHAAAPDYERLKALAALYDQPRQVLRHPMRRSALMLIAFVVGTSAGLAATWWLTGPGRAPAATATSRPVPHGPPSQPAGQTAAAAAHSGISASELPYDGRHPPSVRISASPPPPPTNPGELPYGGQSSGGQRGLGDMEPTNPLRSKKAMPAGGEKTAQGVSSAARTMGKSDAQSLDAARKSDKAYRSGMRSMKEREIERMRKQADDELKKNSDRRRLNEARHTRPPSSRAAKAGATQRQANGAVRTHALLAKCERTRNFIRREQCKWRLCGGMWGKNGCPSYAHAAPY